MNIHRRIIEYYRPFLWPILGSLLVLIGSIGLNLLKPWPVKYVIDGLLKESGGWPDWLPVDTLHGALLVATLGLITIHLLWGLFNLAANFWLIEIGLNALVRLRSECFEKLHILSMSYHNHRNSSDLVYRVAYDAQSIQTFFNRGFATVFGSGLTLVGILLVMWQKSTFLTLLSFGVVPFLLGTIFFFAQKIRRGSVAVQERESRVLRQVNDSLRNVKLVRVMNRRFFENKIFMEACDGARSAARSLDRTNLASTLVVGLVTAAGGALILYFGALEVAEGNLQVGDLWLFLAYLAMFYQPLEQLSYTAWAIEGAAAGAGRVFEVLDAAEEEDEGRELPDLDIAKGAIRFDDVHFSYGGGEQQVPVLRGLSFEIKPGSRVAFVGGTGAGKTTLLSLMPRLYDTTSGVICVDGKDVSRFNRFSLRRHISMVLQETLLLDGTVMENLRYASPDADESACWGALEAAQAADFVRALPQGPDTPIGEQGVRLSGGQRQRLGIARAILRSSPILLLDEPTSSLDLRTEAEFMDALVSVSQRPTTLMVTHRLNTIHLFDHIYVLENGRIQESGTGPELLEQNGIYRQLWQTGLQ